MEWREDAEFAKTIYVFSTCNDEVEDVNEESPRPWLCHIETGRMCFPEHVTALHHNLESTR